MGARVKSRGTTGDGGAVDDAIAALVAGARDAVDRRTTGTVYTPTDVCDLLAGQAVVGWVLDVAVRVDASLAGRLGAAVAALPAGARRDLLPQRLVEATPHADESPRDRRTRRADARVRLDRLAAGAPLDGDALVTLGLRPLPLLGLAWSLLDDVARTDVVGRLDDLRVLDPTCGAGEFLGAAVRVLAAVRCIVLGASTNERPASCTRLGRFDAGPLARSVVGIDSSPAAVAACRARLVLEVARTCRLRDPADVAALEPIVAAGVRGGDALAAGVLPRAEVVLGNPPWVRVASRAMAERGLRTAATANAYAGVLERTLDAVAPQAPHDVPPRIAVALPVSIASSDEAAPTRALLDERAEAAWVASFDCVPQSLFPGTVQRVALLHLRLRPAPVTPRGGCVPGPTRWRTTRYHAWSAGGDARARMLDALRYVDAAPHRIGAEPGSLAKVGTELEVDLLARIFAGGDRAPVADLLSARPQPDNRVWYKRRWSYFLFFSDRVPDIFDADGQRRLPSELKALDVDPDSLDARVLLAVLSSSLFHWWFTTWSDNRNVNRREILALPFGRPTTAIARELVALADELTVTMHANSELRDCTYSSGLTITNRYFAQGPTKPVLDRIDAVLGRHYGLTQAQVEHLWWHDAARRGGPVAQGAPAVP